MIINNKQERIDAISHMICKLAQEDMFNLIISSEDDLNNAFDAFLIDIDTFHIAGEGTVVDGMSDKELINLLTDGTSWRECFIPALMNVLDIQSSEDEWRDDLKEQDRLLDIFKF